MYLHLTMLTLTVTGTTVPAFCHFDLAKGKMETCKVKKVSIFLVYMD